MSQSAVREIYLRVITQTIESARVELVPEEGGEAKAASLDRLKAHWTERLLAAQDFTDDPALVPRVAGAGARRGGSARARAQTQAARGVSATVGGRPAAAAARPPPPRAHGSGPRPPPARAGTVPRGPAAATAGAMRMPAGGRPKPETTEAAAVGYIPQGDAPADAARPPATGEPPAKRARRPVNDDDDEAIHGGEDLDSSDDSDIRSAGSDPEADNYILAQHDRVRKGTGKWKVQLKEGIAHINGRDYLFNRATCDLEW